LKTNLCQVLQHFSLFHKIHLPSLLEFWNCASYLYEILQLKFKIAFCDVAPDSLSEPLVGIDENKLQQTFIN